MAQTSFHQSIVSPQSFSDNPVFKAGGNSALPQDKLSQIAHVRDKVRQLLWKLVVATFLLMAIGSATRVMNAGLACPDWPLCYGTLFPAQQMNLQVFLEWIHRLDASFIGLMTIGLVGFSIWQRSDLPKWLPWTSMLALILVCVQGGLGALTVTALLRFDIVTAHLGTALCFFGLLLGMAIALMPLPEESRLPHLDRKVNETNGELLSMAPSRISQWFIGLSVGGTLMIYGQSLTGGLVGSQWALHQCLTIAQLCAVMNSHLLGVIPSSASILVLSIWGWRHRSDVDPLLQRLIQLSGVLLCIQIGLGVATFLLHLEVEPLTIAHQTTGAALFGTLLCLSVRAYLIRFSGLSKKHAAFRISTLGG
ncbi:MAG: heme A synthase [Cyanobacteria bacterium P01_F01_bin.150]